MQGQICLRFPGSKTLAVPLPEKVIPLRFLTISGTVLSILPAPARAAAASPAPFLPDILSACIPLHCAPGSIAKQRKMYKGVSPNIDFYSGFVYEMLGIPMELYTPLFAIARITGWSAHRIEELVSMEKIIRPAYKSLMVEREYVPRDRSTST